MTNLIIVAIIAYIFYKISSSYKKFEKSYYKASQFTNMKIDKESIGYSELGLFTALCAKVAKVDGAVDKLEAELVSHMLDDMSRLFLDPAKVKEILKDIFNEEKDIRHNLDPITHDLKEKLKKDPYKRQKMMEFLTNLAYIDGILDAPERQILTHIALLLGFERSEYESMLEQFGAMYASRTPKVTIEDAYKTLEIESSATLQEVKKAYRKLVKQYHPDIIMAHGADDDYIKSSTAKMQEVNEAYEMIKEARK
ncbi:MAG: DnaJ domain-containing protein [Helicobacteraceae bacterium]|nr:DnaJ domain-containing protein [Helicobacteraceae bacterium]